MTQGLTGAIIDANYNYQTPASGATVVLANTDWHAVIDPAGTLAALTVQMCPKPFDGQEVLVYFSRAITALTVSPNSGQSIGPNPPTAMTAGTSLRAFYRLASTTWFVVK